MTLLLISPERFVRHVPVGLAFRDASDLSLVGDGLEVRISDAERPWRTALLASTPGGTWMTPRIPGLNATLSESPADWPSHQRSFIVSVSDSQGRYLPVRFPADLPVRGRYAWPEWSGLPKPKIAPLLPAAAPPGYVPDYLPLFPSIARTAPGPRATVRAHLAVRESDGSDTRASWAAMTVSVGGKVIGLGVADAGGAVTVMGPYPALPSQTPAEAAAGRDAIEWTATIRVYWSRLAGNPPALGDILGQLSQPAVPALAKLAPGDPELPDQTLVLGRALTLATELHSSLYLKS